MTPTPFSLFNLVIFAVIRLAGRAGEAEVFSRDGAACGPNGLSANHALGTVLLGRQCFVQRFNKVGPVTTFVVSHDHVGIFLNRDWLQLCGFSGSVILSWPDSSRGFKYFLVK